MYNILFFIAGVSFGYYLGVSKGKSSKGNNLETRFPSDDDGVGKSQGRSQTKIKEERKAKILEFMDSKRGNDAEHTQKISNDDVEKLLGVSDATATNYLQELEEERKIKQIGEEGRFVRYELK